MIVMCCFKCMICRCLYRFSSYILANSWNSCFRATKSILSSSLFRPTSTLNRMKIVIRILIFKFWRTCILTHKWFHYHSLSWLSTTFTSASTPWWRDPISWYRFINSFKLPWCRWRTTWLASFMTFHIRRHLWRICSVTSRSRSSNRWTAISLLTKSFRLKLSPMSCLYWSDIFKILHVFLTFFEFSFF